MKELTFKEVIANIKEGEVYVRCNPSNRKIYIDGDHIVIQNTNGCECDAISEKASEIYKLERNRVSFQAAFKACEEGKEIESCVSGCRFVNKYDEYLIIDHNCSENYSLDEALFSVEEIQGKWYIY